MNGFLAYLFQSSAVNVSNSYHVRFSPLLLIKTDWSLHLPVIPTSGSTIVFVASKVKSFRHTPSRLPSSLSDYYTWDTKYHSPTSGLANNMSQDYVTTRQICRIIRPENLAGSSSHYHGTALLVLVLNSVQFQMRWKLHVGFVIGVRSAWSFSYFFIEVWLQIIQ